MGIPIHVNAYVCGIASVLNLCFEYRMECINSTSKCVILRLFACMEWTNSLHQGLWASIYHHYPSLLKGLSAPALLSLACDSSSLVWRIRQQHQIQGLLLIRLYWVILHSWHRNRERHRGRTHTVTRREFQRRQATESLRNIVRELVGHICDFISIVPDSKSWRLERQYARVVFHSLNEQTDSTGPKDVPSDDKKESNNLNPYLATIACFCAASTR